LVIGIKTIHIRLPPDSFFLLNFSCVFLQKFLTIEPLLMHNFSEIKDYYETYFNSESFHAQPAELYDAVQHIISMKGKRIRPSLLLMACELFGGKLDSALAPAFGIELFHNSTLIHDDIMDEAVLRRGCPSVHKVFGINRAFLAGDVMMFYAYQYLSRVADEHLLEIVRVFNKTAIEVFEGQQMDMIFERQDMVEEEAYLKMIECKTSVLIAASLQIGAIVAGASPADNDRIYQFGRNLGIAFQLKDDYLDVFGRGEKFGKRIGGDIVQNKKTFLLITALKNADNGYREEFLKLMENKDESFKIQQVISLYKELNVKEATELKMQKYYSQCLKDLHAVEVERDRKQALIELAEYIFRREY